jgi:hypothetical protein
MSPKTKMSLGPPAKVRDHVLVTEPKNRLLKTLRNNPDIIELKTSFGGKKSRLDPRPTNRGEFCGIRLSIGYEEDADTTLSKLNVLSLGLK